MVFYQEGRTMPNNGRELPSCPYYVGHHRGENHKSITCEDSIRRFSTQTARTNWIDRYCMDGWKSCPYAVKLDKVYEEIDRSGNAELRLCKLYAESRLAEIKKLCSAIGRLEKKLYGSNHNKRTN